MIYLDLRIIQVSIIVKDYNLPSIRHHDNNLLDPCLQMVQTRGIMDVFEELLKNFGRHQEPPPLP
jgi:hypothetical protein